MLKANQLNIFDDSENLKALDELFKTSAKYHTSKEYFDLLNFINSFPSLAPFNAFLVHMQNPGVKLVKSPKDWRKLKRTVKYNARPLVILVPFGPVEFVYDISDTEGPDVPPQILNPFHTSGNLPQDIYFRTIRNLVKNNIIFEEYSMGIISAGFAEKKDKKMYVKINKDYGINEKYSTIVHELGHVFCGHLGLIESCWWESRQINNTTIEEIEAESISYIVCKRKGLKTSSESYLANYIENHEKLPNISLDTILSVSNYIEQMGNSNFRVKKRKEQNK